MMTKVNAILSLVAISLSFNTIAQDSLKVHVAGHFKDESFQIYYDSLIYSIDVQDSKKRLYKMSGFTFSVPIPENIEEGMPLNIIIKRKPKYGLFFRDTKSYIRYMNDMDYLILLRDRARKDRYPLNVMWTCKPPLIPIGKSFWEKDNDSWPRPEIAKNKKGTICVRGSANDPRMRTGIKQ